VTSRLARPAERRLGRPRDGDSAETRAKLLVEARRAFARDGYEATTNRAIAEAAGITPGAIYHYVASKADLYAAVYTEVQDLVMDAFHTSIEPHRSLVSRFSAALDAAVRLNRMDPSLAGFLVGAATELRTHPELREVLGDQPARTQGFVHRLVSDAVANGELADGVDPRALEDLLGVVLSGLARFSNVTQDADRHEAAVGVLKRFLSGELLRR
jgi:AcrR family transcriptional regulator